MAGLLSRERIIAKPGFNRWLVPPAALAIHLSIGMAYGFSVFWLPLSRAIGITEPVPCPAGMSFFADAHRQRTATGRSARSAGCTRSSSCSWLVGRGVRALAGAGGAAEGGRRRRLLLGRRVLHLGSRRLPPPDLALWLGSGVIGGCGLGLGYISPVEHPDQVVPRPARHGDRAWRSWASAAAR